MSKTGAPTDVVNCISSAEGGGSNQETTTGCEYLFVYLFMQIVYR